MADAAMDMRPTALVFLVVLLAGCANTGRTVSDYEYRKVTEVDASADRIYDRSLSWMAERFVSANDAIQVRDKKGHRLVANATREMPVSTMRTDLPVEMSLIVEAKDGRFRLTARNFKVRASTQFQTVRTNPTTGQTDEIEEDLETLRVDLKNYIQEAEDTSW